MARLGQKLVVFRSSFPRSRLAAAGTQRDLIGGDTDEEGATGQTAMTTAAQSAVGPCLQGVERALEAEAFDGHIVGESGFQEQRAEARTEGVNPLIAGGAWSR